MINLFYFIIILFYFIYLFLFYYLLNKIVVQHIQITQPTSFMMQRRFTCTPWKDVTSNNATSFNLKRRNVKWRNVV